MQNSTVHIKHSLKDLRRNNPGTLSPPSLHKWEMLSNSNPQMGDLRLQTTQTHSSRASSESTWAHACSKAYTPPHRVYVNLGLALFFFKPCCFHSTSLPILMCEGCHVLFTAIHYRLCVWCCVPLFNNIHVCPI